MKPSDILTTLPSLIELRRPVMLWGGPGVGKSSVVHQLAVKLKHEIRDVRLSQLSEIDIRGFPMPDQKTGTMRWLPADFLPTDDDPPGILFLDEMNAAPPSTAAAAYQLILDFRIGSYVFPKHWTIIAAGNRQGDRGVVHTMPSPLSNRFIHLDFDLDLDDWLRHAASVGIHPHIRAYHQLKSDALYDFDPVKNPRAFPTPRTWEFLDQIYKTQLPLAQFWELAKGTIGEGHAATFIGFVKDLADMPDMKEVWEKPKTAPLPKSPAVLHTVITTLIDRMTFKDFDRCMEYIFRLGRDLQVVFVTNALHKDQRITNSKSYITWGMANVEIVAR